MSYSNKLFTPLFRRRIHTLAFCAGLVAAPFALATVTGPQASNDATSVTYQITYSGAPTYFRVYLDTDHAATSGFQANGIGANYLVENNSLYRYTGTGTSWAWSAVKNVTFSNANGVAKWTIARTDLGTLTAVDLVAEIEAPKEAGTKVSQVISDALTSGIATPVATSDATNAYYKVQYSGTPAYSRLYLDSDKMATTGFPLNGAGANYLVENDGLYKYTGTNGSWSWLYVKPVTFSKANGTANWTVARADIGAPTGINVIAETEAPKVASATVTQVLSSVTPTPTPTPTPAPTPAPSPSPTSNVSYSATTAQFANPERGFLHQQSECNSGAYNLSTLKSYRTNDQASLVLCVFYLRDFKNSAISQSVLDFWQSQMDTVRAAGLKVVVRFGYTTSTAGDDAPLSRVLSHLDQLAPYFAKNSDVIQSVEAGFVGAWGEWGFSQNFGTNSLTAQNMADRKTVAEKLLQVVPAKLMVLLRTPKIKTSMYGTTALTDSEAYNGTPKARLGHHNDCLLASATDMGTYSNTAVDYPYLAAETKYVQMGGETCQLAQPRSDCPTALAELGKFHWTYLNADYNTTVLNSWKSQGCYEQVKQKLGYRFALQSGTYSTSAKPGGSFSVKFTLQNQGWASPTNARKVELVLRNTTSGALHRLSLTTDPRLWMTGQTVTVNQTVTLPAAIANGNYAVFLNFPDSATTLATRAEYSIQLANANMWEASTGFNNLNHVVAVAP
ncbi:hypothetical protein BH11PSE12_BH11PSE12_34140 [soil metagenome]